MSGIERYLSERQATKKTLKGYDKGMVFAVGESYVRVKSYSFWKSMAEPHQPTSEQSIRRVKGTIYYLERFVSMLLLNNV